MTIEFSSVSTREIDSLKNRVLVQEFSEKEILVTGASGMIGSYFVAALQGICLSLGITPPKFTLLVRQESSRNLTQFRRFSNIRMVETELHAWKSDREFDFLLHAASPASPTKYGNLDAITQSNVSFTENIMRSRLPKQSLFISSGEVYGSAAPVPVYENYKGSIDLSNSRSAYPMAKIKAEELFRKFGQEPFSESYVVRLFHTFGPGMKVDDGRSFADFLWEASQGHDIHLRSTGADIRTFLYLEDAFAGLLKVFTEGQNGETYNLGSSEPLSILDFAQLVGSEAGVDVFSRSPDLESAEDYVPSPNAVIVPSTRKIESIGWQETIPIQEAINRTLAWAKNQPVK